MRGGLGTGGFLPGLPGSVPGIGRCPPGLVTAGLGGADAGIGVGAGLGDGRVPFGFGGSDPRVGVGAGLGHGGVAVGFGGLGALPGFGCAGQGGGEFLVHLLGGGVGLGTELVGFGGAAVGVGGAGLGRRRAGLGGGAGGLDLGLGGGRVGQGIDPVPQVGAERGDPVGLGAQRPQQLGTGDPGHGHRGGVIGRAERGAGLLCLQAAPFAPCRHAGVAAPGAVLWWPAGALGRGGGLLASRVLARRPRRGAPGGCGRPGGHRPSRHRDGSRSGGACSYRVT